MAVNPYQRYSNGAERGNQDIYDDFKFQKNPLISMVYTQIFQRFKGLPFTC